MLVVLETLSPLERSVFVLREVFGYSHAEIASMLGSNDAAVRQLAHRAREHVHARRPRFDTDDQEHLAITKRFADACSTGQVEKLLVMLSPDLVALSDGGGKVSAARRAVVGADKVSRLCVGLGTKTIPEAQVELRRVNGQTPVIVSVDGVAILLVQVTTVGGLIDQIFLIRNPDKLRGVR